MDYTKLSKEISYALRHEPRRYGLELDEEGFAPINQLLEAINNGNGYERDITRDDLEHIIDTSEKIRHEIVGDRIRALYGHSVKQRIFKAKVEPPAVLYHGTTHAALPKIMRSGLKPMGRQYVHLSADIDTAISTGARRDDNPVLLKVDAETASKDGIAFFVGSNNVWLSERIPQDYLFVM